MPKGRPLTQQELHSRRAAIVDAATDLFLQKGFGDTSMASIAAAAGMGKSSLYDYFRTKDDILLFLVEEGSRHVTEGARAIAALPLPPDERLRRILRMELDYLAANVSLHLRLSAELQGTRPGNQRRIQELRYVYQDSVAAVIQEGIDMGCFRPVDPLLAARLSINSLVSILYTSRPTGSHAGMLEQTLAILLEGLNL